LVFDPCYRELNLQKLVAIGGGTGLSTLLAGLKQLVGKADQ
jgi:2-phospho-L-lactate transferase/gluconeogenesis factor (CofD/UPF0052 family)